MLLHTLLLSFVVTDAVEIDFNVQDKIAEGEQRYGELMKKVESYGDCWKIAMSDLKLGCKRLTEEVQSRLALSFANCFLKHAGLDPCPCPPNVPISNCLKNSSDRVFSTYTEFFTHTQSICHYLLHKEWQEEASKTVMMLTENSAAVSEKLDESSKFQSKILELQQNALSEQQKMISTSHILNTELLKSRENARHVYDEFKTTTKEQRLLLFEVFDRVKNLQNFVLGEFTGVYTAGYYLIAASLTYILTSVQRTSDSRIWMILVISLNAGVERIITSYSLQEAALDVNPLDANVRNCSVIRKLYPDLLYCRIWLCRKGVCLICFMILLVFYYRYKDYNVINNQLLREIQQQNMEIQMYIKGLKYNENMQNLSILHSSTKMSSIVFESKKEGNVAINTDTVRSRKALNGTDNSISHYKTPERSEDKENNNPLINSKRITVTLKKTLEAKLQSSQKKKSYVRSRNNTPNTSVHQDSISSELESPIPRRYNLRSSSRLNSPQLSP